MHYYIDVLKKYTVFAGRATRKEFWMFTLWNSVIYIVIATIVGMLAVNTNTMLFLLIDLVYVLSILPPTIGVSMRRLHDTGRSGWWLFIDLVPIVGVIVLLVFFVQDSRSDNQYGLNPKRPVTAPKEGV